jgi:hypothetical protein
MRESEGKERSIWVRSENLIRIFVYHTKYRHPVSSYEAAERRFKEQAGKIGRRTVGHVGFGFWVFASSFALIALVRMTLLAC